MLPFLGPDTQYEGSIEIDVAITRSDATWVSYDFLRSDLPDWWYPLALDWLDHVDGELPWKGSRALILTGIKKLRKQYEDWRKHAMGEKTTMVVKGRTIRGRVPGRFLPTGVAYPRDVYLGRNQPSPKPQKGLEELALDISPEIVLPGRSVKTEMGMGLFDLASKNVDGIAVETCPWLPLEMRPDQQEASEYSAECARLQASKVGRKAKRILLDNLTPPQQESYFRKGYFLIAGSKIGPLAQRETERPPIYAILRGYPNGNIIFLRGRRAFANFCYHPKEPFPLDDILLTQKLMIEHHHEEFLEQANIGAMRKQTDVDDLPTDLAYLNDISFSGAAVD